MDDRRLSTTLRLIHQDRTKLPDPPGLHERVLAIPTTRPRRHRWLPQRLYGRGPSMFSATKFIVAAAIVALCGGFLLSGVLTTPQGEEVAPAAVTESPSPMPYPASVVITARGLAYTDVGTVVTPGEDYGVIDSAKGSMTWDATDSRLSGAATYTRRVHTYPKLYGDGLEVGVWTIENEDGMWRGEGRGIHSRDTGIHSRDTGVATLVLIGDGAYEGLTAYLAWDRTHEADTIRGLILAEDWPPLPEPAA